MLPNNFNNATTFNLLTYVLNTINSDIFSDAAFNETFAPLKSLKPHVRSFYTVTRSPIC